MLNKVEDDIRKSKTTYESRNKTENKCIDSKRVGELQNRIFLRIIVFEVSDFSAASPH
jgi:hypothetical protein